MSLDRFEGTRCCGPRRTGIAAAFCLFALCHWTAGAETMRELRTAMAVRGLSGTEAARGYPVKLRAVVTYSDPADISLFVHDASGGVFVQVETKSAVLPAGTLVEVRGVSAPGSFAPIVEQTRVRVLGMSHLPTVARRVSLTRLATGQEDCQWVELEGLVHSVVERSSYVILQLATPDGTISATMLKKPGTSLGDLTDARVSVRATAAALFNDKRQMIGPRLVVPDIAEVRVVEAAPSDPFGMPVRPIEELSKFTMRFTEARRAHLRGRVTLVWPGSLICLDDGTGGLCARTGEAPDVRVGMEADVIGFPANGESAPILTEASVRWTGPQTGLGTGQEEAGEPSPPHGVAALSMANDAKVVEVEGELLTVDLTSPDATLLVSSGSMTYRAVLPSSLLAGLGADWRPGSRVRLRGICSAQVDSLRSLEVGGPAVAKAFRLLLRSPADVVMVSRPTWWTPGHSLLVVGGFFLTTSLVLIWVAMLRRTVERQTKTIRESEECFRYMAQHDALTGLATRALLHERLEAALAICREEGTGLALLMVDLDHFKAINDSYGHDAGDETLRVTAERMTAALREGDTVARLGGDEFIVLLTGLHDLKVAERVAAELVEVLSRPIPFGEERLPVSASVGVCGTLNEQFDARSLLKSVDAAMYRAKAQGRRRFQAVGVLESATV